MKISKIEQENIMLREALKELIEAEWMVEATWSSSSKRKELLEKVEKILAK
jgi:hypothetical protein